jgi:hypothetical protein
MLDATLGGGTFLDADPAAFATRFDREAFAFHHRLADHPLFAPDRLLHLAQAMARDPKDVYYDSGDVRVGQRWDEVPFCDMSVEQLLSRIETANAWIILRRAEKFPEYAAILDQCLAEVEELTGRDLGRVMKVRNAIVFINSPHRVSSYHIDRECSVLMQLRGRKVVHVFDRNDRDVLPERELEHFWTVDNNSAKYKPQFEERARLYELTPGAAIHIPVNAPHWVQNGAEVSVSLNINFHYHDELLADVYRANYWLRRLGLDPTPPRQSATLDGLKRTLYGSARSVHRTAERIRRRPRPGATQ